MGFKKLTATGLILGLLMVVLVACPGWAGDPVKIGVMAPITGAWASEGQDMVRVVELLADEVNKAGGAGGHQIIIEVGDDGGSPKIAISAANKLVDSGVVAVIGTYGSGTTVATQDIYAEAGVIQIANASSANELSERGLPLFFRVGPRDDDQGLMLVKHVTKLGFKRVALINDKTFFAKALTQEVIPIFGNNGVEIVYNGAITSRLRDYIYILNKIKKSNPDIIVFTGYYPEAAMILRQKKEMGWEIPIIGGGATNNKVLRYMAGSAAVAGYYFISPPGLNDMTDEVSLEFLGKYRERYKAEPSSVWSMMAGDAFKVLVEAVANTPEPTAKNLAVYLKDNLKDFVGFTGPIAFNEKGDRLGDVYRLHQVDPTGAFALVP